MTKKVLVAILLVCLCGSVPGASNMKQKSFTPESNEHETETQKEVNNLRKVDTYVGHITGVTNSKIAGANNTIISSESATNKVLNSITENNSIVKMVNDFTNNKEKK